MYEHVIFIDSNQIRRIINHPEYATVYLYKNKNLDFCNDQALTPIRMHYQIKT